MYAIRSYYGFFDVFPFSSEKDRDTFAAYMKTCLDGVSNRVSDYAYVRGQETLHINININPLILHA